MATRQISQIDLERVAAASGQLVEVAKYLASLISQIESPSVAGAIESQAGRLLDIADQLSSAATKAAGERAA